MPPYGYPNSYGYPTIYKKGSSAPAFDPSTLDNLLFYMDADQMAFNNGDPVGTIDDRSSNNFDTSSAGAARPTYLTNSLNGRSVISFDGVDDVSAVVGPTATITKYSLAFVYQNAGTMSFAGILSINPNADIWTRTGADTYHYAIGGGFGPTSDFTMPQTKGAVIVLVDCSANNVKVYVNNSKVFDGPLSGGTLPANFTLNGIQIGAWSGLDWAQIKLATGFATTDHLTAAEITSFFTANRAKYSLY